MYRQSQRVLAENLCGDPHAAISCEDVGEDIENIGEDIGEDIALTKYRLFDSCTPVG